MSRISQDSKEGRFVSAVGELTYLGRANSTRIAEIDFEVRRPLILNSFDSTIERAVYEDSYSDTFEQRLTEIGLEEIVFALNGLKVAANALKGRNIIWTASNFRDRNEDSRNSEYILGSRIGFYSDLPTYPAAYLELSADSTANSGLLTPIAEMWDIDVVAP